MDLASRGRAKADTRAGRRDLCCCWGCPLDDLGLIVVPPTDVCWGQTQHRVAGLAEVGPTTCSVLCMLIGQNCLQMIDEVHTLIGAGAAEGAIDAANILKPALARGELQCIGATTLDEYRKHIEKDPALERWAQMQCMWLVWLVWPQLILGMSVMAASMLLRLLLAGSCLSSSQPSRVQAELQPCTMMTMMMTRAAELSSPWFICLHQQASTLLFPYRTPCVHGLCRQ